MLKFPINTEVLVKKPPFLPDTSGRIVSHDGEKYVVEFSSQYMFFTHKFLEDELDFFPDRAIISV